MKGALVPNFSPKEHTVLSRKGGEVVIENARGQTYRRNVRNAKKLNDTEGMDREQGKRQTRKPRYLVDYDLYNVNEND